MTRRPTRRQFFAGLGVGALGLVGTRLLLPRWLRSGPIGSVQDLSSTARALVREALADVEREQLWDLHAHVVGFGQGGTGCWVNPDMRSHLHPIERFRFDLYLAASGVTDPERADEQYWNRLVALHRAAHAGSKLVALAFDYHVDSEGREVPERSPFHTPNDYVLDLAGDHADVLACASVHPYREDALERLERAAVRGAVAVKWLPNAMGIDPASERCDSFYERLVELDLPLLTHAGLEKAVHAEEAQALGNPLRLRRPLEHGVRVLCAHCASLGESVDIDAQPAGGREQVQRESFDLFLRLMDEPRYEGLLFGEISGLTQNNRSGHPLRELLVRRDLHPRLVNGSDYPLPAVDPLFSTRWLVHRGVLDSTDRGPLNEIFGINPLLFDYVLKRRVRIEAGGAVHRFLPVVFESGRLFGA